MSAETEMLNRIGGYFQGLEEAKWQMRDDTKEESKDRRYEKWCKELRERNKCDES